MSGINKAILIGRIGKDPDIFTFEDGTKRISFSLATTESYRDRNTNEWVDQTEWHNIVGYRYLAERKVAKGDLVYIEGKIKTRKYKDRDNVDRYVTEILADKINMMSSPRSSYHNSGQSQVSNDTISNDNITETPNQVEDDLPF